MRPLTAVALCGVLQMGALCAPLVHAHLDDHQGDHHDAPAVHAHFGGHAHGPAEAGRHVHEYPASGFRKDPAIADHDESEPVTRLQIFVAVQAAAFTAQALPAATFVLPEPRESWPRRLPELVRSHGPPVVDRTSPRAPPVPSV